MFQVFSQIRQAYLKGDVEVFLRNKVIPVFEGILSVHLLAGRTNNCQSA